MNYFTVTACGTRRLTSMADPFPFPLLAKGGEEGFLGATSSFFDSLQAAIRQQNTADSLPVFTIGNLGRLETSRVYADEVVESLYEYLLRIDEVRGTGRLFLPADVMVGRTVTKDITLSLEVSVPVIKDYPVYDFRTVTRFNVKF